jgi:pSer/pThr/pTyr-binding forkhead associated (FHA) protein
MAKIILSIDETVLREIPLTKERITIGRRPHNDIVLDHLAISGEHAVIVTRDNDSFLEDLNSTNGTQVNGQPVRKHFLQDHDVIELAQFRVTYLSVDEGRRAAKPLSPVSGHAVASLTVLNGPAAGREIALAKILTTIGRPDVQVAVVAWREGAYFLSHVEGEEFPLLNGEPVTTGARQLCDGDIIDLSGSQMRVLLR